MADFFNHDFRDLLLAFNKTEVEYMLVGGYAVILHGYERVTGDLDIWVHCTEQNYTKIEKAFLFFGMPLFDMTLQNFLDTAKCDVFRFGRRPIAIDIMTKVKGLDFLMAFEKSEVKIIDGFPVKLIHYSHLIISKREAGRNKDLNDLDNLSP